MAKNKIGTVYRIKLPNSDKVFYFQYVGDDDAMMGAEIIRVFKAAFNENDKVDLEQLAKGDIAFHLHTTIYFGLKLGMWKKVGSTDVKPGLDQVWFRTSGDYGDPGIKISSAWSIWHFGGPETFVGDLPAKHLSSELGFIFAPIDILNRLETGNYKIVHPHPKCSLDPLILPP